MPIPWRLIVDEALPGAVNMARDAALFARAEESDAPQTTLRFYRWDVPTLSLGNKQRAASAADGEFCRRHGIAVVRRPTGGAAVLHHLELTYSVVSNDREYFPRHGIMAIYLQVSRALCRGLQALGVPARIVSHGALGPARSDNYIRNPYPCFSAASHFELVVGGHKIIGSAQKRGRRAFLQHGSIPCAYDWPLQAGSMRARVEDLQQVMTSIGAHVPDLPPYRDLAAAFARGFEEVFHLGPFDPPAEFDPAEERLARALESQFQVDGLGLDRAGSGPADAVQ
jgi:lipoyl(octanoyl) transferase